MGLNQPTEFNWNLQKRNKHLAKSIRQIILEGGTRPNTGKGSFRRTVLKLAC